MPTTKEDCFRAAAADLEGAVSIALLDDYSGRAMYGRRTVGVVASMQVIFVFLQLLGQRLGDEGLEPITDLRTDSMGMDAILYIHR